ncbi:uncharacterized protein LOC132799321 [Ziziphus jujuba]|uniref:Uncharacterized protein LOC132799321 n=1 Tax=Ziziphus jujuba TaxID=326968 RepID=A0ABM4A634_ZIZJJ|nr:uncharacterized protein LOC132799321 [Ziziphus jujuba]
MTVDVLSFTFGLETAFSVWHAIEEQLLPATKEKEIYLTNRLMGLKKGSATLDKYLKNFNSICDNLSAIGKPVNDLDKCFHLSRGLGHTYQDFRLSMLSKPPYPTYMQFVLSLRSHEQVLSNFSGEKQGLNQEYAFVGQRSHGTGRGPGGRFSSHGRGFGPTSFSMPNHGGFSPTNFSIHNRGGSHFSTQGRGSYFSRNIAPAPVSNSTQTLKSSQKEAKKQSYVKYVVDPIILLPIVRTYMIL